MERWMKQKKSWRNLLDKGVFKSFSVFCLNYSDIFNFLIDRNRIESEVLENIVYSEILLFVFNFKIVLDNLELFFVSLKVGDCLEIYRIEICCEQGNKI